MFKQSVGPLVLVSAWALFATVSSVGCGSDSKVGGTGGKGTGGKGTGGAGTGGSGTGGAATGGAATGGAATGGAAMGGSGTGGSAGSAGGTAGSAGGTAGSAGGTAGSAGGTAGSAGGRAGSAGGTAGSAGGSAGSAGGGGGAPAGALATILALTPGTIAGTAEFVNVAGGVQVTINLQNCPMGTHGIHIHAGTGCGANDQGVHWPVSGTATNPTRGEGIGGVGTGEITCNAQMVGGPLVYTRVNTDPTISWTIGGDVATNVIGHPIIVHGLVATNREGCGVIQAH